MHPVTDVISVSDYCRRATQAHGFLAPGRIQRLYNGVNISRVNTNAETAAHFRRSHGIRPDSIVATQISWMIPEKGVADFLEAGRAALTKAPQMHFLVVGEGQYRPEYEALAAKLGMAGRVTFTGRVEDPFQSGVFAATDMLCQFSRWNEAFGWTMAEAMAHYKPVIATRVGGIPEVVTDGVTGILVNAQDRSAMTEAMLRLAGDAPLRWQMGVAGRRRVESDFEVSANVARLLEIYGVADRASVKEQWALPKAAGSRY